MTETITIKTHTFFNSFILLHRKIITVQLVNLTLSANHPAHPCTPAKGSAHAYTQNCVRMHIKSPENAHARAQRRTHLYN